MLIKFFPFYNILKTTSGFFMGIYCPYLNINVPTFLTLLREIWIEPLDRVNLEPHQPSQCRIQNSIYTSCSKIQFHEQNFPKILLFSPKPLLFTSDIYMRYSFKQEQAHSDRQTQTDTQTDIQTHRQTDRRTERYPQLYLNFFHVWL